MIIRAQVLAALVAISALAALPVVVVADDFHAPVPGTMSAVTVDVR